MHGRSARRWLQLRPVRAPVEATRRGHDDGVQLLVAEALPRDDGAARAAAQRLRSGLEGLKDPVGETLTPLGPSHAQLPAAVRGAQPRADRSEAITAQGVEGAGVLKQWRCFRILWALQQSAESYCHESR